MELFEVKPYEQWEDIKYINWKLTAKYNKLFVNIYRQEKDTQFHIFFDINYNWKGDNNLEKVIDVFLDIFIFAKRYWWTIKVWYEDINRKKIIPFDCKRDNFKVYYIINLIKKLVSEQKFGYKTNLTEFIRLQKHIYKRHVIIIFSDFLDVKSEDIKFLKIFSEKNEIFLFKLPVWSIGKNYTSFDINQDNINNLKIFKDRFIII